MRHQLVVHTVHIANTAAKIMTLADTNAQKYQDQITVDKQEAADYGVSSTPTFLIAKQLSVGALPYETVKTAIDGSLGSK